MFIIIEILYINSRSAELSFSQIPFYISIVLLILPFFITKSYKLLDKTWLGTIVKVEPIYFIVYGKNVRYPSRTQMEVLLLDIKTGKGRLKKIKAFEQPTGNASGLYPIMNHHKKGDKVIHISGTKYLQVIEKELENTVCIVCGSFERTENNVCSSCGYTLKITSNKKVSTIWSTL